MKAFALSVCPLSLHLVALLCGEDYFPYACLYEAFAILLVSLVLMRLSSSIFTTGCVVGLSRQMSLVSGLSREANASMW